jgi:hypothetical protein
MELKDRYDLDEVLELFDELIDLGVDLNDPDIQDTILLDLVKMSNRLRS